MYKMTETYVDYNGVEKTEDFYFNMNEAELLKMQLETEGGMDGLLDKVINTADTAKLIEIFQIFLNKSYGVKTADGKFKKNAELTEEFMQTAAYSKIYMKLITDDKAAAEFINGILPKDLVARAQAEMNKGNIGLVPPTVE